MIMRVIAGTARRLLLKTVEGRDTRPTTDRIKETLFNMLQPYLPGSTFLDLFAGSGAIGIEALSRGSREAVFVENSRKAGKCIQENLAHTHFDETGRLILSDVLSALSRLESHGAFDVIFMDPPYGQQWEEKVLGYLAGSSLADEDTLIVTEALTGTDFSYLDELGFVCEKIKTYKTNEHVFIRRKK